MEKELLEKFRVQLEDKRDGILNEAGRTLSEMTDQNSNVPDPNDRASIESDRSFELRIRDRERKLLGKIEEALERVEDGTFGICDGCGEDIGIKRLEARPVTTLCIDCKTLQETNEKAQGQ
jgi:DnaK suppressor protein